jgi:hypothetical protein
VQGDRRERDEFTIERGRGRDAGAGRSSSHSASNARDSESRSGQSEFDLGRAGDHPAGAGMPERLRRKYYVAEARVGDEAKVYADPRGEYLAFKVSADRMATRLEDAGLIRDMISVAQHRGWQEVEIRGSEEFRRTAWLEASLRGLAVRGFEPDPVDRAALAFRAKPDTRPDRSVRNPLTREAGASETVTLDGMTTRRPIDAIVMPPERREHHLDSGPERHESRQNWKLVDGSADLAGGRDQARSAARPTVTIDAASLKSASSHQLLQSKGQQRADAFRSANVRHLEFDEVVRAARTQLAAIDRALNKAVADPALRRSVLAHAKERIAEQLEKGSEFKQASFRYRNEHTVRRSEETTRPYAQDRSSEPERLQER